LHDLVAIVIAQINGGRAATTDQQHDHNDYDDKRRIALLLGFLEGSSEILIHLLLLFDRVDILILPGNPVYRAEF
jgi:hypothetical protein